MRKNKVGLEVSEP